MAGAACTAAARTAAREADRGDLEQARATWAAHVLFPDDRDCDRGQGANPRGAVSRLPHHRPGRPVRARPPPGGTNLGADTAALLTAVLSQPAAGGPGGA